MLRTNYDESVPFEEGMLSGVRDGLRNNRFFTFLPDVRGVKETLPKTSDRVHRLLLVASKSRFRLDSTPRGNAELITENGNLSVEASLEQTTR